MSLLKANAVQLGQSLTATNNFTLYQPATPDGTVRLGNGNSGSVTDLVTLTSAGNLGIGTSSPSQKLNVVGNALFASGYVSFGDNGYIRSDSANNKLTFQAGTSGYLWRNSSNSADQMALDSSGNLGLGVTPKTSGISGYIELMADKYITSQGDGNTFASNSYYSSGWKYSASALATRYTQYGGQHQWHTAPSGTAGNVISWTQAMTLDASGNLSVGTTSSANGRLTVQAGTSASGYSAFFNNLDGTYNPYLQIQHSSGGLKLYVSSSSGGSASTLTCVAVSGGVYLSGGATSWAAVSDEREKDFIEDISNAVNKVDSLRAVIGKYKEDEEGTRRAFLFAQDALAVFPEAVDATNPDKLGLRYTDTIPLLVAAIKELSAELNELKQKVNA